MKSKKIGMAVGLGILALILASGLYAQDRYEVTITNLTRGQVVTPPVVFSFNGNFHVFQEGEMARPALATLAESGNPAPLMAKLETLGRIFDVVAGGGVVLPGQSVTLELMADDSSMYFTAVGMLAQTNDAFFGIQRAMLPQAGETWTYFAPAYDAGSEGNNEIGDFIPGPPFGGSLRDTENAEGFVHIHSGVFGTGGLTPSMYDWRNPVVKIMVKHLVNESL